MGEGNKIAENCSALNLKEGLHLYSETDALLHGILFKFRVVRGLGWSTPIFNFSVAMISNLGFVVLAIHLVSYFPFFQLSVISFNSFSY